jgi:hypothetical protein
MRYYAAACCWFTFVWLLQVEPKGSQHLATQVALTNSTAPTADQADKMAIMLSGIRGRVSFAHPIRLQQQGDHATVWLVKAGDVRNRLRMTALCRIRRDNSGAHISWAGREPSTGKSTLEFDAVLGALAFLRRRAVSVADVLIQVNPRGEAQDVVIYSYPLRTSASYIVTVDRTNRIRRFVPGM